MTSARLLIGDVRDRLADIPDNSVDFLCCSPPFLALRSYLPVDHPDKNKEIGSERTPADYLDVLLDLTGEFARVLAPHGSIAIELGDTYAGSGRAGGDYNSGGLRDGQEAFDGSASRDRQGRTNDSVVRRDDEHPPVGTWSNARFRSGYVVRHSDGRLQAPNADTYDVNYQKHPSGAGAGWPMPNVRHPHPVHVEPRLRPQPAATPSESSSTNATSTSRWNGSAHFCSKWITERMRWRERKW